jgi:hypothetical protein
LLQLPKKEVVRIIVHFAPCHSLSGGNWAFDPVGDSGDGGEKLRRGGGGGARPQRRAVFMGWRVAGVH